MPLSRRYFLTGPPGCGKTTAVRRAAEKLRSSGLKVGGMLSGELRQGGVRVGFEITNLETLERGVLARVAASGFPKVGKYVVNLQDLKAIAAAAIESSMTSSDVIVIDEVGPMELYSDDFVRAVERVLDSRKLIVGTVHRNARHSIVDRIKSDPTCTIVVVTEENRSILPEQLSANILRSLKRVT